MNKLERNKYVESCLKSANQYEEDVISGKIIVSEWIRKSVLRERELRAKYNYDIEKVKAVFQFCYYVFLSKNKRFVPLPFQAWIILSIYSLYRDNGKRLRKYGIIWMARKNGKTAFTAVLALYELMKGAEQSEVYFLATTSKQASVALNYLKATLSFSPALKKRVDSLVYHLRFKQHSILKPLANNPDKLDGLNPSFAIIDESHSHPNRDLFNIMDSGMKARENPLLLEISTAGFRKDYPFYNQLELAKKVLNGDLEQDNTFYALYTLDDESELEKPETWIKSNPALGTILDLDTLIEDMNKSKLVASDFNSFVVKNLNFYTENLHSWIDDEFYKKVFTDFDLESLKGSKAFLGIDLAATRDLAALVVLIEKDDFLYVQSEHFIPQNPSVLIRKNGLDLTDWINAGYITQTENNTIDYDYIAERIAWYVENFEVVSLGYDQWNSSQIISQLQLNLGLFCVRCPQTVGFFNTPLRFIEKYIIEEKISMSRNPVLRWMFRNVILFSDGNGNIKAMKNKSLDSIDGVVALAMAMGMYLEYNKYKFNN